MRKGPRCTPILKEEMLTTTETTQAYMSLANRLNMNYLTLMDLLENLTINEALALQQVAQTTITKYALKR